MPRPDGIRAWIPAALAGIAAVLVAEGAAELFAALTDPAASPAAAIGTTLIQLSPPWAKEAAITVFGTNDKTVLLILVGVAVIIGGALAGILEWRRPPWGKVLIAAGGAVAATAALIQTGFSAFAILPSGVAAILGILTLNVLIPRIPQPTSVDPDVDDEARAASDAISRRRFLRWTGGAAAIGVLAALGGVALQTGSRAVGAIRDALHLPSPTVTAGPIPVGADLHEPGLVPLVTPNRYFYRIDTAVVVPQIDPANWKLRIHGMVDREVTISWDELLALPLEESYTTLTCVSNPIGGNLAGNALWLGYPIRHLLERAGVSPDADMVLSRSQDGFTASTPLEALTDDRNAILAVGMNSKPLPIEHGFPVRMVVPGLYGYVSATKWVVDLKVTRFDEDTAFWTTQGYAAKAPIKLMSRIDLPATGQTDLAPGPRYLGGVAWYQHVGVERVEIQVDGGDFHEAELGTAISDDTWVQWRWKWDAPPGIHSLRVRAIGKDGQVQTGHQQGAIPDGATGWHEVDVNVAKPQ